MAILKSYNCHTLVPNLEDVTTHSLDFIINNIKQNYISFWQHQIEHSSKLSFYSTFKKEYNLEKYLTIINDVNKRRSFTRFRISNHKLMVESGRYQNILREERICQICNLNEVETENHFLTSCNAYENIRQDFLETLANDTNQSGRDLLLDLTKSTDDVKIIKLSKFIYSCFEIRDKRLETMNAQHK